MELKNIDESNLLLDYKCGLEEALKEQSVLDSYKQLKDNKLFILHVIIIIYSLKRPSAWVVLSCHQFSN